MKEKMRNFFLTIKNEQVHLMRGCIIIRYAVECSRTRLLCVCGKDYYMVNSSFIFFPCIPVSHSRDLIHWEIIGHAITDPQWAALDELEGGRGYWAPDISYDNGKFYVTATYRLNDTGTVYRKQIVVSSDRPEGPYSKPAVIDEDGN